jgi:RNA-directed DNA polymerase
MSLVSADSPEGGETSPASDASERRNALLHKARNRKTKGLGTGVADESRLLEQVASEANLARALLEVVRNKGTPGMDGDRGSAEIFVYQAGSLSWKRMAN